MLDQFKEQRQATLQNLQTLSSIAAEMGLTGDGEILQAAARRLQENRFSLAVCGMLKNGKSTLINSLLGEAVLPTGVTPQTAVVTYLSYGPEKTCRVLFEDGRQQEIRVEEIAEYAIEEANPNNSKGVKALYITYPLPLLRDGLVIIDTPGVGSIHPKHSQFTYEVLPYVDAVIFLLAVDQPLSQGEIEFLRTLARDERKTFFVQNKKDRFSPGELEQSLNYAASVLKDMAHFRNIRAFALSARQGLKAKRENDPELLQQSGLQAFEEALGDFLVYERGAVALSSVLAAAGRCCRNFQVHIERERAVLAMAGQEQTARIAGLEQEIKLHQQERGKLQSLAQYEVGRIVDELSLSLRDQIRTLQADLLKQQVDPEAIQTVLREQLNVWALRIADVLKERLKGLAVQLMGEVRKADEEINWLFNRAFGLSSLMEADLPDTVKKDEANEIMGILTWGLPPLILVGGPVSIILAALGAFYGYQRQKEKNQAALRKQLNAWLEDVGRCLEEKVRDLVLNAGGEIEAKVQQRFQAALDDLKVQVLNLKKAMELSEAGARTRLAYLQGVATRVRAVQDNLDMMTVPGASCGAGVP